ncbi:MAG TPA: hypothetical protein VJT09_13300 [Pyrinomonadaceae bacterium]|nr:hypothetical protein [Pyrinomonadaceae bacterium]
MAVTYAMGVGLEGGTGRALLVAALAVTVYALARYWRSLEGRPAKVRYTLVALRAVALVLVSCALAGLRLEYESMARARVLMRGVADMDAVEDASGKGSGARSSNQAREQAAALLRAKGLEVVEADDESGARMAQDNGSFVAGVLVANGPVSAPEGAREVERLGTAAGGAPVFVLANYGAGEEATVTLEGVSVLGRAVRGVPVAVRCTVRGRGMQGRETLLTISDDAKVQASARIVWAGNDERQSVTITVVPKTAGWIDYSAKVEAAGGETPALLTRPFTVYAEERRLRVLFFESEPTWEAKFIRRALEQAGLFEIDYYAQVSRSAVTGISEDEAAARRDTDRPDAEPDDEAKARKQSESAGSPEAKLHAALRSAAALNAYDCVIVGASANALLSPVESARLREWVERRGGGLVILGGNSFNGSIVAPGGKLYTLLPAEVSAQSFASAAQDVSRGRPLEAEKTSGTIPLTPTEAGASGALGGYLNAFGETARAGVLTGQGLRLGALRPGATALAVAGQAGTNGTSEAGASLIAAMRYGAGRSLVFAPADSWRLRTSASADEESAGRVFDALWQGIVLWTSAGAGAPAEIVLSDESPAKGSTVTAEVRVRDASFLPSKIEKLSARLQPLAEETNDASGVAAAPREIGFVPDTSDASVWRAQVPLERDGRFVLEVEYLAGGRSGIIEKRFAVVTASSPLTAGAALDTLRRVSRETGGELIETDVNALASRLAAIHAGTESVRRTWEARTFWPFALLVPLLLSTEWFLRRWWREDV